MVCPADYDRARLQDAHVFALDALSRRECHALHLREHHRCELIAEAPYTKYAS
jgi:hypothetical protein